MKNTNTTPDGLTPSTVTTAPEATEESPAAVLPIGAQTFPRLYKLICKHYTAEARRYTFYIKKGYFPEWAPEHRADPERGIEKYLTPARLKKYKCGELTRSEAVKIATARALKEVSDNKAEKIEKLNAAALAAVPFRIDVTVKWTRSRTWGYNPRAEIIASGEQFHTTTGRASGCGYDKRSAAIAEALNESAAVLRLLYTTTEKALKKGYKPPESGALFGDVLGYGAGYSVLPYFEGGCGFTTIKNIFSACGFVLSCEYNGDTEEFYTFTPAPVWVG